MADLTQPFGADPSQLAGKLQASEAGARAATESFEKLADTYIKTSTAANTFGQTAQAATDNAGKSLAGLQQAFKPLGAAASTVFGAMLSGTKNWDQTVEKALSKMAASYGEMIAKMLAQWAGFQIAQSLGWDQISKGIGDPFASKSGLGSLFGGGDSKDTQAANQQISAATTQKAAAGTQNSAATIMSAAADAMSALGGGSGGGGAGGALGGLFSLFGGGGGAASGGLLDVLPLLAFDVGSWSVPGDMVARIHQGEMIIPAGPAQSMRDGATFSAGGRGALGGGGNVHLHVHAIDGHGVKRFFEDNGAHVADALHRAWKNGNPRMR